MWHVHVCVACYIHVCVDMCECGVCERVPIRCAVCVCVCKSMCGVANTYLVCMCKCGVCVWCMCETVWGGVV